MKALVEAIETVIGEFNVKINEQFGENFKKLNEAVGKLLEWQENYYKQIEYMVQTIEILKKVLKIVNKLLRIFLLNMTRHINLLKSFKLF